MHGTLMTTDEPVDDKSAYNNIFSPSLLPPRLITTRSSLTLHIINKDLLPIAPKNMAYKLNLKKCASTGLKSTLKHYNNWDHYNMLAAINAVQTKVLSMTAAAKLYNIPRTTLRHYLNDGTVRNSLHSFSLQKQDEEELVMDILRTNISCGEQELYNKVLHLAIYLHERSRNKFDQEYQRLTPTQAWIRRFVYRHIKLHDLFPNFIAKSNRKKEKHLDKTDNEKKCKVGKKYFLPRSPPISESFTQAISNDITQATTFAIPSHGTSYLADSTTQRELEFSKDKTETSFNSFHSDIITLKTFKNNLKGGERACFPSFNCAPLNETIKPEIFNNYNHQNDRTELCYKDEETWDSSCDPTYLKPMLIGNRCHSQLNNHYGKRDVFVSNGASHTLRTTISMPAYPLKNDHDKNPHVKHLQTKLERLEEEIGKNYVEIFNERYRERNNSFEKLYHEWVSIKTQVDCLTSEL